MSLLGRRTSLEQPDLRPPLPTPTSSLDVRRSGECRQYTCAFWSVCDHHRPSWKSGVSGEYILIILTPTDDIPVRRQRGERDPLNWPDEKIHRVRCAQPADLMPGHDQAAWRVQF